MSSASDLTAASWQAFSRLLDEALERPAGERLTWLEGLGAEHESLKPALRAVLVRSAGVETAQWLATLPHTAGAAALADESDLRPEALVGSYRLIRELGVGGMGAVWLAERADGTLKRQVALKLPRATWSRGLAERMARERDILAALEHPNIARLYDAGTDAQGRPYLALEYVEGQPIDAYCRQRTLSVRQRLDLLLKVAQAVAFAHSRLVVHRDLKPSNVLVTADGQVRLLDFGIAKLMEGDSAQETQLTQLAGRALTLDYASPEQIRGEPIGTASDVYSLGVLAYELLTGSRPYKLRRGSAAELEEAIAAVDAPLASATTTDSQAKKALKGDLDAILNKALKKEPDQRYATVDAFARDVERYLAGHRVAARPDSLAYRLTRFARRYRTPLVAAAITVAAFGLAIGVGATALVILALLLGLAAALWQAKKAREQAEIAREKTRLAQEQTRVAQTEARTAEAVQDFLEGIFRASSSEQRDPEAARRSTARELLDRGARRVATALDDTPAAKERVFRTLARMYDELTLFETSHELQHQRVALLRDLHKGDHRDLALGIADLAKAASLTNRGEEAAAAFSEAAAMLERIGEHDSEARGCIESDRAYNLSQLRRPEALQAARRAAAILRRYPPTAALLKALERLAHVSREACSLDERIAIVDEALGLAESMGDAGVSSMASLLMEQARLLLWRDQAPAVEASLRRAHELALRREGPDSIQTLNVAIDLGQLYFHYGEFSKALDVLESAAPSAEARLNGGDRTWVPPFVIAYRGAARAEVGRLNAGIADLQRALTFREALQGNPPIHLYLHQLMSVALRENGNYEAAAAELDRADELAKNSPVLAQRQQPLTRRRRLELATAQGDRAALTQLLTGYETATDQSPMMLARLAEARFALGDFDEALRLAHRALQPLEADPHREWRREAESAVLRVAGLIQLGRGQPAIAKEMLHRALDATTGRLDPQVSPRVATLIEELARAEGELGHLAEAESLRRRAKSIRARRC